MIKEPKISVVSACYNHGKYIHEMLESVLSQTFQNFEVIIVDDGSTDNTAEILQTISHEKVKIIISENHGPAEARNIGIREARAPLIMNLDADDKLAQGLFEKAYTVYVNNSNAGIIYCEAECFGAKSGKFEIGEYSLKGMLSENRITSMAFFRKEDWQAIGGYSSDLIFGLEDWDLWLSIIELGREVVKIPERLVYYRIYNNLNISRSGRRKRDRNKMLESRIRIFHRHEKVYSEYPKIREYFSNLESNFKSENFLTRFIKNTLFYLMQKYLNDL